MNHLVEGILVEIFMDVCVPDVLGFPVRDIPMHVFSYKEIKRQQ